MYFNLYDLMIENGVKSPTSPCIYRIFFDYYIIIRLFNIKILVGAEVNFT